MEIVYWDGKPGSIPGLQSDEYLVWDCDRQEPMPGWYRLETGLIDPIGPFDTEAEARPRSGDKALQPYG